LFLDEIAEFKAITDTVLWEAFVLRRWGFIKDNWLRGKRKCHERRESGFLIASTISCAGAIAVIRFSKCNGFSSLFVNHYHLQIRSPEISFAKLMAFINKRYANYYNTKYCLTGHVFEKRYYDKVIEDKEGMLEVSRYIH